MMEEPKGQTRMGSAAKEAKVQKGLCLQSQCTKPSEDAYKVDGEKSCKPCALKEIKNLLILKNRPI